MPLRGTYTDRIAADPLLQESLRTDDMTRFRAVPKTVMINPWQDDLEWFIVDGTYPHQIACRHALLARHPEMVIDRMPGAAVHAAERELLDTVVQYLLHTYPRYFRRDGELLLVPLTGLALDVGPGADPLVALSLLISEDILLLLPERDGDGNEIYRLRAGALLFPNGWSLRSQHAQPEPPAAETETWAQWHRKRQDSLRAARLGKTPWEIHDGHVAHYIAHFASRVDRYFSQMAPGSRSWRRNWGMKMRGELFLHPDAPAVPTPEPTPENWARHGYLRSEHETFAKLPRTRAVVFGIKTYLWKLSDLVRNPVALQALLLADDQLAPGMVAYRAAYMPSFRAFLDAYRSPTSRQ